MKCPLCHAEQRVRTEEVERICGTCGDIIEFGYPSFPAYVLEEQNVTASKKQEAAHGSNGRQLTAVG